MSQTKALVRYGTNAVAAREGRAPPTGLPERAWPIQRIIGDVAARGCRRPAVAVVTGDDCVLAD
jgi:hypothetical protein